MNGVFFQGIEYGVDALGFIPYIIKCGIKHSQYFPAKSITLLAVEIDFSSLGNKLSMGRNSL